MKEHRTSFSVSLPCTVGGSDYTHSTTMVTFSSGSTSRTVTVVAEGDNVIEDEEMFTLSLTSTDTAIDMLMLQSATVTITDQTSKYIHCYINRIEATRKTFYQYFLSLCVYPPCHPSLLFSGDCWV